MQDGTRIRAPFGALGTATEKMFGWLKKRQAHVRPYDNEDDVVGRLLASTDALEQLLASICSKVVDEVQTEQPHLSAVSLRHDEVRFFALAISWIAVTRFVTWTAEQRSKLNVRFQAQFFLRNATELNRDVSQEIKFLKRIEDYGALLNRNLFQDKCTRENAVIAVTPVWSYLLTGDPAFALEHLLFASASFERFFYIVQEVKGALTNVEPVLLHGPQFPMPDSTT